MADSKKEGKGASNAIYWVAGAAATAGVFYFAQRYLRDRDELMEMRMMDKLRAQKSNPALSEAEGED